jgi:hypothetical protein
MANLGGFNHKGGRVPVRYSESQKCARLALFSFKTKEEGKMGMNEERIGESKEEQDMKKWLEQEEQLVSQPTASFEKRPSPVFVENRITVVWIDFSKPFDKWQDPDTGKVKAIIPCESLVSGKRERCFWWLNLKNPVYKDIIRAGRKANTSGLVEVRVTQTGSKENTKYILIEG